jgi:hypothetical protein
LFSFCCLFLSLVVYFYCFDNREKKNAAVEVSSVGVRVSWFCSIVLFLWPVVFFLSVLLSVCLQGSRATN